MATIIDGGMWTLTEAAAEDLEKREIITKCEASHYDVLDADNPIYHLSLNKPDDVGIGTLQGYITEAEKRVEHA